jgi:hypothetical protein
MSILDRINGPGMGGKDAQDCTGVFSPFPLDTVRKVLRFGGSRAASRFEVKSHLLLETRCH